MARSLQRRHEEHKASQSSGARPSVHSFSGTMPDRRASTQRLMALQAKMNSSATVQKLVQMQAAADEFVIGAAQSQEKAPLQEKAQPQATTQPLASQTTLQRRRAVVQFGKLHDVKTKLGNKVGSGLRRRIARSLLLEKGRLGKYSQRNNFVVTVMHQGVKVSFHLRSAGLGGKHPRYKGKSSAHTEQQWRALMMSHSPLLRARVNIRLKRRGLKLLTNKDKLNIISVWSINEPCDSNPGDHKHGCSGIPLKEMGLTKNDEVSYTNNYNTGKKNKKKTKHKIFTESKFGNKYKDNLDSDSSDDEIDSDLLRDVDIDKVSEKKLKGIF